MNRLLEMSVQSHMGAHTKSLVFITYATKRFIPSLHIWLRHVQLLIAGRAGTKGVVWLGADLDDGDAAELRMSWPDFGFLPLPKTAPANSFDDYWAAEHYAWKLWILRHTCTAADRVYIYADSGVAIKRLPAEMIAAAEAKGICFVEDTTQKNRFWFSDDFKTELATTETELDANQIQAATIVCTAAAAPILDEAYRLSLRRSVIAGPKWLGVRDGQPFGHRHDQAILSLLRLRHGIPTLRIDDMQSMKSSVDAVNRDVPFYVHRGNFVEGIAAAPLISEGPMPLISDIRVINLERRADRLAAFKKNHPDLDAKVHKAVDGCSLTLTSAIARVLRPNDFFWKKAVAGCALSHLGLWHELATSKDASSYLILEDDAKLASGWEVAWRKAAPSVPADWDVLYLGGVLPPNLPALNVAKERVSDMWHRIKPNSIFGQREPTRYFHFCAYAYVLSKAGAQKIIKMIEGRDGFFTSADHIMCNHYEQLNLYFLDPKLASCTQEDDPVYRQSQFNNFNRIDKFDSDLWNNDERWTLTERLTALGDIGPLEIASALKDVRSQQEKVDEPTPKLISTMAVERKMSNVERNLLVRMMNAGPDAKKYIMEMDWLEEMLNCTIYVEPMVATNADFMPNEVPWIIVSRQDLEKWLIIFKVFEIEQRKFYAIHLSDEFGKDDISWYGQANCLGVIRTYWRPDATDAKAITLPLGYAQGAQASGTQEKSLAWSFEGTNWFGRAEALAALESVQPHEKKLFGQWNDPGQKTRAEYAAQISRSQFVPCVRGNHFETFRMYEALEAGSVPIYVRCSGDDVFWNWLSSKIPLLNINSWTDAARYMTFFRENPEHFTKYRDGLVVAWASWKKELKESCAAIV